MLKCKQKPYPIWFSTTVHRVEPAHCRLRYSWKTVSMTNLSMPLSFKFVRCRAQVLVKHFNGIIHARSISLIHWIMVTLGIENCALHYEAIVWWSLKRIIAVSFLCTNAQCPMHNCQWPIAKADFIYHKV